MVALCNTQQTAVYPIVSKRCDMDFATIHRVQRDFELGVLRWIQWDLRLLWVAQVAESDPLPKGREGANNEPTGHSKVSFVGGLRFARIIVSFRLHACELKLQHFFSGRPLEGPASARSENPALLRPF